MPTHDNGLEKLRKLAHEKKIPEVRKSMIKTRVDARIVVRNICEELARLNTFTPARQHAGEKRTVSVQDKSHRSYQFTIDSDGKSWAIFGHSIYNFANFINTMYGNDQYFDTSLEKALKNTKDHIGFHKQLIDINPIIGACILLGRSITDAPRQQPEYVKYASLAEVDPAQWYESHLILAERALNSIDKTFSLLRERCTDQLTQSFLNDYQRECELLIAESCSFSFMLLESMLHEVLRGRFATPCFLKSCPFPISSSEYSAKERDILQLRNAYIEHLGERLETVFPMPDRNEINKKSEIQLPVYISIYDIEEILKHYVLLWDQVAMGLSGGKAHQVRKGRAKIYTDIEIGVQSGNNDSQDRLSFRMPSFNIRVDKDTRHKTLAMDVGCASLSHILSCAEDFLQMSPSNGKAPSIFRKDTEADNKEVRLENKIALLASVIMNASQSAGMRKIPTIAHHSKEFVAKDEYYNNFTHILESVKDGLERPS